VISCWSAFDRSNPVLTPVPIVHRVRGEWATFFRSAPRKPMRTPLEQMATRHSLTATATRNARWFARTIAGTAALGAAALATTWEGDTSVDWNDGLNWSGDAGTGGTNAVINSTPANIATIAADIVATPVDILVGDGAATNGRLIHTAGSASTGNGNWMVVGRAGGIGIYDLTGSGSMIVGGVGTNGRLYVGADGTGTVNMNTSGTLAIRNDLNVGVGTNGNGTVQMDGGTLTTGGWNFIGNGNGSTGTFNQTGGTFTNSGRTYVGGRNAGGTNSGTGNYNISGGTNSSAGEFSVGSGNLAATVDSTLTVGGTGTLDAGRTSIGGAAFGGGDANAGRATATVGGSGTLNVNGEFWVGQSAGSSGTLNVNGGAINVNNWVAIGRDGGSGTVNMTGGTFTKTGGNSQFIVGASGPATMTLSGGLVDVQGGFTWVGESAGATTAVLTISGTAEFRSPVISVGPGSPAATLQLDGGTVRTRRFTGTRDENGGDQTGNGTIHFNGSQIIATADDAAFIARVDTVNVDAGGLRVESNGFILTATQDLGGTGGVVKTGAGTLNLNGIHTYPGLTNVNAGTLGGSGTFAGAIAVLSGAELNPGVTTGVLAADSVNIAAGGTLVIDLAESGTVAADQLRVANNLTISGATLDLNGTPTSRVYLLATYGTLTGTFAAPSIPSGYTLDYAFGGNRIAITRAATAFDGFIDPLFPGNPNDPAYVGPNADPDADGDSNLLEFALGGDPASGSDSPKVFPLIADSDDAGTAKELLLTIAVRDGTPVFLPTSGGSPTATRDGVTYTIQGSLDLVTFNSPVSVVATVAPPAPDAVPPAGYTYRTFSLAGSDGLPGRGFLRVTVTP
jgi:fibronectin-binding autotransporter adhesin